MHVTGPRQVGKTTMLQKMMEGVQESLAGRTAVLSMTTLSQAEISGAQASPLSINLTELKARELGAIDRDNYIIPIWVL